jgi:hypothetical protein
MPKLFTGNAVTLGLFESEHKKPVRTFSGRHQRANASALASPGQSYTLFEYTATQVSIDQAGGHLSYGCAQSLIRKR